MIMATITGMTGGVKPPYVVELHYMEVDTKYEPKYL